MKTTFMYLLSTIAIGSNYVFAQGDIIASMLAEETNEQLTDTFFFHSDVNGEGEMVGGEIDPKAADYNGWVCSSGDIKSFTVDVKPYVFDQAFCVISSTQSQCIDILSSSAQRWEWTRGKDGKDINNFDENREVKSAMVVEGKCDEIEELGFQSWPH